MHEIAVSCALMDVVSAEVRRRGLRRVTEIRMSIGGLQGIEPRVLVSSFEMLAENTEMEGAILAITRRPVRIYCRDCRTERVADRRFRCEACQGDDVKILPGDGMTVDEIVCQ